MPAVMYCKNCGATPGDPSNCIVDSLGAAPHRFVASDEPVVCANCGAAPGKRSHCNVESFGYAVHRFLKASELPRG